MLDRQLLKSEEILYTFFSLETLGWWAVFDVLKKTILDLQNSKYNILKISSHVEALFQLVHQAPHTAVPAPVAAGINDFVEHYR